MDRTCEFCGALQPVVYCQPDAAFLCLSCDAKVHSANALSGRHSRALVCDSCRSSPAHFRCMDHLMLLCRRCEARVHQFMPHHRMQRMSSFTGCPSARHFAALWGFGLGDLGPVSVSGHGSQQHKVSSNQQQEQKYNNLIKQQILELEKLQLTQGHNNLSTLHRHGEPITSSSMYDTLGKLVEGFDRKCKELEHFLSNDPENPSQETKGDRYPSSISQLDHLSCSSSVGEPFWQYKSLGDDSQFWSQNLQDLGVCEDLGSLDDLNIPDVDVTFRNFEDLFKSDLDSTRALLEEDDMMFSHIEKGMSIEKSVDNSHTEDVFAPSSISSKDEGKTSKHNAQLLSRSVEYSPYTMMRSTSFSRSRLSGQSSGSECPDSGNSGGSEGEGVYNDRKKGRK